MQGASSPRISPREQGDVGEASAIEWLVTRGYPVYLPLGHSPDCDLIAQDGPRLLRVQVKTSTVYAHGRWAVTVCTRGGNRSWSGLVKRLDPARIDFIFVLVADGRRWFIPAAAIGGGAAVHLGGPKYAAFEVEPGMGVGFAAREAGRPATRRPTARANVEAARPEVRAPIRQLADSATAENASAPDQRHLPAVALGASELDRTAPGKP
jgi:hypothetical protein